MNFPSVSFWSSKLAFASKGSQAVLKNCPRKMKVEIMTVFWVYVSPPTLSMKKMVIALINTLTPTVINLQI